MSTTSHLSERVLVSFEVNGRPYDLAVAPNELLVNTLRYELGLTGTKEGCGVGVCGACTVLRDGAMVSSCLLLTVKANGCSITTVEGLAGEAGELSELQQAFVEKGAVQCGICTPGHLVAATALLAENPSPTELEVKEWLMGNLCRCTGYYRIVEAVLSAAGDGAG
jgi:aerobic-type carbon monoxide dehydrogenase small subunit (CoxS/CutS family)